MNVKKLNEIRGVEWNAPSTGSVPPTVKRDRVSADSHLTEAVVACTVKANAVRVARMRELEGAIKAGQYRPNASQLADQILSAAEIDARLRAMLQQG